MLQRSLTEFAIRHPKLVMWLSGLITLMFLLSFPSLTTDTDPIKMLPANNPAIKLYKEVKQTFQINDLVFLGINAKDNSSLFTPERLERIDKITREILAIRDVREESTGLMALIEKLQFFKAKNPMDQMEEIFVSDDVISLSTVDDIVVNPAGELLLKPLMQTPPATLAEAQALLAQLNHNPILADKLAAKDGSLVGIFLPLQNGKKDRTYFLAEKMKVIAEKYLNDSEEYYLAGLPVAENTFGNEMFIQMGVYAPAAGVVIFLLMLFFFRSVKLVLAPMLLGVIVVTWSMGALIYSGNSIHIMSSMIPIFLLPIAVLNSIHIMSRLHDHMPEFEHRADAVRSVMKTLFNPMLYTSVTTIVGFVSLATTGIPPVIVFGVTIGFGVFLSWLLSMVFVPAYFMLLSDQALINFGKSEDDKKSVVMEVVHMFKGIANQAPRLVILAAVVTLGISAWGLTMIIINDNPVRWFKADHVLRKADHIVNGKLAGTYQANLVFSLPAPEMQAKAPAEDDFAEDDSANKAAWPSMREPEALRYMARIDGFMKSLRNADGDPLVGGTTSLVDILKKIGQVAFANSELPDTREKVSQYMFLFESGDSKKGKDMWKFITPGASLSSQMWLMFKSGDNQRMIQANQALADFMVKNPPPKFTTPEGKEVQLQVQWSGLTYINKVWQDEMVQGMMWALVGSFGIVFVMMVVLFRSVIWGVISMLPLTLTIMMIYGSIGFVGKFYDMPIAVLSSLTLGLSVDFAIHFIESAREIFKEEKEVNKTFFALFQGTAQAIWRNVLVISIGFTPLFFSGLVPYVTVGSFFFAIMLVSGITTLILLPAILKNFGPRLTGFGPVAQLKETKEKACA